MTLPKRYRLYSDLAWLWPMVSSTEHYAEMAEAYLDLAKRESPISATTILHLGCGGGHADFTLKKNMVVTGVDVSEEMLVEARSLNPEVTYHLGDMRSIRLGHRFDVVFALDSVNYLLTEDDLLRTFRTAYNHLHPGGVFLTFVEETVERFQQNKTYGHSNETGNLSVTFVQNYYDPELTDTTYEAAFVYFIRDRGVLSVETDLHVCGVFPLDTWTRLLKQTGFDIAVQDYREEEESRSCDLLVALRPIRT